MELIESLGITVLEVLLVFAGVLTVLVVAAIAVVLLTLLAARSPRPPEPAERPDLSHIRIPDHSMEPVPVPPAKPHTTRV